MVSEYVKALTGLDESPQLTAIYQSVTRQLIDRLAPLKQAEVPAALEHIVDEVTIARFNRIGSEGMAKESVEGHSADYNDVTLDDYTAIIEAYIDRHAPEDPETPRPVQDNVVRFL